MNILVLSGSPHKNGSTAVLADAFIKGAQEAGHAVTRVDTAFVNVHPCMACEHCHQQENEGSCIFKDDMAGILESLLKADAVVLISPIWYYSLNTHLRKLIDRFYAKDAALHGKKKALLITAMGDTSEHTADGAVATFKGMCGWLEWENAGMLNVSNCYTAAELKPEDIEKAEALGKGLK